MRRQLNNNIKFSSGRKHGRRHQKFLIFPNIQAIKQIIARGGIDRFLIADIGHIGRMPLPYPTGNRLSGHSDNAGNFTHGQARNKQPVADKLDKQWLTARRHLGKLASALFAFVTLPAKNLSVSNDMGRAASFTFYFHSLYSII